MHGSSQDRERLRYARSASEQASDATASRDTVPTPLDRFLMPVNGGSLRNGGGKIPGMTQAGDPYLSIAVEVCMREIEVGFHYLLGIR